MRGRTPVGRAGSWRRAVGVMIRLVNDSDLAVATDGLIKRFGSGGGLDAVDLRIRAGRVYALLGPNGAGKSTTLKLLLGLLEPDAGRVLMWGRPWQREVLARVGARIDGPALYAHLSATRNLEVHARLLDLPPSEVARVLDVVGLAGTGRQRVRTFSTGMRGRLALAVALLGDPDLLVLDEPQNGLDPEGVVALRALIRSFAAQGRTVIVSSHLLGEVVQLADDVGVLVDGRLRPGPTPTASHDRTLTHVRTRWRGRRSGRCRVERGGRGV